MNNNEWISVKDRLPENNRNEDFIVFDNFFDTCNISTASFSDGNWYDYLGDLHKYNDDITHWMPLPKPPSNE